MKSLEGEVVPLQNKVLVTTDVEVWLSSLASQMKSTLQTLLVECVASGKKSQGTIDPLRFPSQILCLAEQIQFTEDVENAVRSHNLHEVELELTAKLEHYTSIDDTSGSDDAGILELKLKALILDIIHNMMW
ncbi:unnamed protein product [Staurois parvus]|uniref:Uncharacterized protein n=1 Tax=Staurois parvus TaxID=386267 RepID=A0ABN9F9K5_9NEOB|nr:unnamed protein product [Staurois parvus]